MSYAHAEKEHGIFHFLKPKCLRGFEGAIKRLDFASDKTLRLLKENGHALNDVGVCSDERTERQNHQ